MRWVRIVAFLGLALALVFLRDGVSAVRRGFGNLPDMVMDLPGSEGDFTREFDAAVKRRFPPGSEERKLVEALRAQGFTPDWVERDGPRSATFVHEGLVCSKAVTVRWSAGADGSITSSGGNYDSRCIIESPFTAPEPPRAARS